MKKAILALSAFFLLQSAGAQHIQNLYIVPQNPTTADNITFYADVSFNSGPCFDKTQSISLNGNTFYAYAIHCIGPLAYICDHTDTFDLGFMPAGNYMIVFMVDNGMAPSPCTPGIVAGPSDTLLFTVNNTTSVAETESGSFNVHFNGQVLELDVTTGEEYSVLVYTATGSLVGKITGLRDDTVIPFAGYSEGLYIISLQNEKGIFTRKIAFRK